MRPLPFPQPGERWLIHPADRERGKRAMAKELFLRIVTEQSVAIKLSNEKFTDLDCDFDSLTYLSWFITRKTISKEGVTGECHQAEMLGYPKVHIR